MSDQVHDLLFAPAQEIHSISIHNPQWPRLAERIDNDSQFKAS